MRKKKKYIFYPNTLAIDELTITDGLVYSQMLFRSLWDMNEVTFTKGHFDIDEYHENFSDYVPLGWTIDLTEIAKDLKISERQLYYTKKRLKENGLLTDDSIYIINDITTRFFELVVDKGLSGWELIVYSYLANKNKKHTWITLSHEILSKDLNIRRENFERIVSSLKAKGLIEKEKKGERSHQKKLRTK